MKRELALKDWLDVNLSGQPFAMVPASEDASFRRYLRVSQDRATWIVMDAPPAQEDCSGFIAVNNTLSLIKANVPRIHAADLDQGFLLLDDLGETLYLDALNEDNADALYRDAMDALHHIQQNADVGGLPPYDRDLLRAEMELFVDWFICTHLDKTIDAADRDVLDDLFERLIDNALSQPQVFVHRDYHSRNLMVTDQHSPGILDFQDAVLGPVTYDLVSLLKDCYIAWPAERVDGWSDAFRREYNALNNCDIDAEQWGRWFDLMGVQRHLKAIGIFCRLNYRDKKSQYLGDISRTMQYITDTAQRHPELADLQALIERLRPRLQSL